MSDSSQTVLLIIDDDHSLVVTLKEGLESQGFKVAAAYDGLQGVFQAHQNKPAAIILDFNMPAGGGVGVYERLRASTDTSLVPIIFLTGVTVQEVKEKIRPTPHTYFLRKPASLVQLRTVLDKILGPGGAAAALGPAPDKAPASDGAAAPPAIQVRRPASKGAPAAASPAPGKCHEFELRVTYADTDRLGLIYYANYFRYFEQGRTELLRSIGLRYRDLESERGLNFPVVEARCEYIAPCRYDDLLTVRTWLSWMGPASLCFQNEVYRKEGGVLVAKGFSRHAALDRNFKPTRLPADIRSILAPNIVEL